jgi:hypothetical protein
MSTSQAIILSFMSSETTRCESLSEPDAYFGHGLVGTIPAALNAAAASVPQRHGGLLVQASFRHGVGIVIQSHAKLRQAWLRSNG